MKDISIKTFFAIGVMLLAMSISSCKKTEYLNDGGLVQNTTSLSTYDYLQSSGQFDTLLLLIDHFKLKDSLNKAATVFAFTDFAAAKFMKTNNYSALQVLYDSVSSKFLTQYMFSNAITLDNSSVKAALVSNWAGSAAPSAVAKALYTETISLTSSTPTFNYYTLTYIKINGVLDGSVGAPADDKVDVTISCQTQGIKTSSGNMLHVLINNAPLNKL